MPDETQQPAGPDSPEPGDESVSARVRRRRPWTLMIILVLALVVLAGLIAVVLDRTTIGGRGSVQVPDLRLSTRSDAEETLSELGLELGTVGQVATRTVAVDRLAAQEPAPGTSAERGSAVDVKLAVAPVDADIPDVTGMPQTEAAKALADALFLPLVFSEYSDDVPAGTVVEQAPLGSEVALTGSPVIVFVSLGPGTRGVAVPDVVGQPTKSAFDEMDALGLEVVWLYNNVARAPTGEIVRQAPRAGAFEPAGAPVVAVVSVAVSSTYGDGP